MSTEPIKPAAYRCTIRPSAYRSGHFIGTIGKGSAIAMIVSGPSIDAVKGNALASFNGSLKFIVSNESKF